MIDTISLVLTEDMFVITDHSRFTPSTAPLFGEGTEYSYGSRGHIICKQNQLPSEIAQGIYKPHLSVTKRFVGQLGYQTVLKIELSLPKLHFGNNFDELVNDDFFVIVATLHYWLGQMGVEVDIHTLIAAPVSLIHYGKNIPLTDHTTPYSYLKYLYKVKVHMGQDLEEKDYRNGGRSVRFHTNSGELIAYDKLFEMRRAKISEKRSREKDNLIQRNLFDQVELKKPFEVLRIELRLNNRKRIKAALNAVGIEKELTLANLFDVEIARKLLLHELEKVERNYPSILLDGSKSAVARLNSIFFNNPGIPIKRAIQSVGLAALLDEVGVREVRTITEPYGYDRWLALEKELNAIVVKKEFEPFKILRKEVDGFEPLRLADFVRQK